MSESALMADVILPEATYLERDEGISSINNFNIQHNKWYVGVVIIINYCITKHIPWL